jgi:hypothetical protein
MTGQTMIVRGLVILLGFLLTGSAYAQSPQHFPLDHRVETGVLSRWNSIAQPGLYDSPQPVRITLPGGGQISFVEGNDGAQPSPTERTLLVGHVYRVRISDLPDMPGVELYPTIELIDRLHPPAELADEFPVPIDITADEIQSALDDRMVIKVVYLENPELASREPQVNGPHITDLAPSANLIETATHLGRPVAILRMGGRIPLSNSPEAWQSAADPIQYSADPRE